MRKQLSRGACFGVAGASMIAFMLIVGMISSLPATYFLGTYIAYLLFQLIFFYIFRTIFKNKDRGWATLLVFIGFATIPAFLAVATQGATSPTNVIAPASAFLIITGGWWIYFAAHKSSPVANEKGNPNA